MYMKVIYNFYQRKSWSIAVRCDLGTEFRYTYDKKGICAVFIQFRGKKIQRVEQTSQPTGKAIRQPKFSQNSSQIATVNFKIVNQAFLRPMLKSAIESLGFEVNFEKSGTFSYFFLIICFRIFKVLLDCQNIISNFKFRKFIPSWNGVWEHQSD